MYCNWCNANCKKHYVRRKIKVWSTIYPPLVMTLSAIEIDRIIENNNVWKNMQITFSYMYLLPPSSPNNRLRWSAEPSLAVKDEKILPLIAIVPGIISNRPGILMKRSSCVTRKIPAKMSAIIENKMAWKLSLIILKSIRFGVALPSNRGIPIGHTSIIRHSILYKYS